MRSVPAAALFTGTELKRLAAIASGVHFAFAWLAFTRRDGRHPTAAESPRYVE